MVQPFIFSRCPPPGRRIRTPSGPAVHLHSLSAARKAYPDRARVVQPFIFTRYPPPGRRIRTPSGPGVHLHSLSAARKADPDPEWSRRSSSLAIRRQEGVSAPRVDQAFIFTRSPLPGRRIRPRLVQVIIFTRYPPPGRHIRTPSGPTVHLHSLSATRKAYPDPVWSRRSSTLASRLQKGVSGPRVVQSFIVTRCPLPGRRIGTPDGPAVHLHSLSASRKAYPDPEWSSRSSSLAIRCQEGVSGPRQGGPAVHLHSLSAARKAYPDPEWSRRSSSLAIRRQEGVS